MKYEQNLCAVLRKKQGGGEEEEEGLTTYKDFGTSGLQFIEVPEGVNLPVSTSTMDPHKKQIKFFTEYREASRYEIQEVIGKGNYGVVSTAIDTHTGEKVAIKKINDVFENVSDAMRVLREIKLLRLLRHPDIVEIRHIMLPPSPKEFRDIYVVFELMESDLHQIIKANDDLTPEHYQFFLYQLLRGLKYIHTNILANAECKLKICDFGLARVSFNDTPVAIFWTPELCGSFYSNYTPAIDIWSIGCIFAELLTGKPLFPGKKCGTPARRYLSSMRKKQPVSFEQRFPNANPLALRLLERLLAFDPKDRPTTEAALADPYFHELANVDREPLTQPISRLEFEFESIILTKDYVRELIYLEILKYHPQILQEYLRASNCIGDQEKRDTEENLIQDHSEEVHCFSENVALSILDF
ncbi:hypothetical protein ACJIZ3_014751 [Penstemon smallii]|uniref:Protein kinase domain-containing protein n=1 Tax=Penstemon smallii TaxID=265156 RepID=A0ABD3RKL8_9LAMI